MNKSIELLLFSSDSNLVRVADQGGIDGFIIDLEKRTTESRIKLAGNSDKIDRIEDIKTISKVTSKPVWCRINQYGAQTSQEIKVAIDYGADLILLPMVKTVREVEDFIALVKGQAKTGILIETTEACELADELAKLPLEYIYVGLLDLSISRQTNDIFAPLTDGTVEHLRKTFSNHCFGVGGLTTIDAGSPVPCLQLMTHLIRLHCDFTFLRNSFKKDIINKNMATEILAIRQAWSQISSSL